MSCDRIANCDFKIDDVIGTVLNAKRVLDESRPMPSESEIEREWEKLLVLGCGIEKAEYDKRKISVEPSGDCFDIFYDGELVMKAGNGTLPNSLAITVGLQPRKRCGRVVVKL